MAWWDGTFDKTDRELQEAFPNRITDDLWTNEDESKIALINRWAEEDPLYSLADPHMEEEPGSPLEEPIVFYHVFVGEESKKAQELIARFIAAGHGTHAEELLLIRHEADRLFEYSEGEIALDFVKKQAELSNLLPEELKDKQTFILPLMAYRYSCPVCGYRTLSCRGMFEICIECGWEDEGIDDEDEQPVFGPNGDDTIREFRKKYLALKKKDPNYHWKNEFSPAK